MTQKSNIARVKAIEKKNRERLLKVNPMLNDSSGIYFLTRIDEDGIRFSYVGQAVHILSRLAQHLTGYQHIDLSLKKHGLYSQDNPFGWKIGFMNFPESELDEKERYYIKLYAQKGYQSRNKDTGGGAGKSQIAERRPARGYYDGIRQGRKNLAKELKHIIDTHLTVTIRPGKEQNKVSQKALEKFNRLLESEEEI